MDWPKGLKRTRQRELVCDLLSKSDRPLRAIDIFETLRSTECISMSTVYRILDAFEKVNFVDKLYIPEDDNAFYKLHSAGHHHYATCLMCHRQIPLDGCPVENLKLNEELPNFTITGHRLEIYGYCRDCLQKLNRQE